MRGCAARRCHLVDAKLPSSLENSNSCLQAVQGSQAVRHAQHHMRHISCTTIKSGKHDLLRTSQAMEHITRIARIIDLPRGNAMLVGVGGSGKQSLARLASFICGYDVFQIRCA